MLLRKRNRAQVGRGIGSILSVLWTTLAPFAKQLFKWGKKAVTSNTAKEIGRSATTTALEKGVAAVNSAMSGEPIKDSLKKNAKEAGKDILKTGVSAVTKSVQKKVKKRKLEEKQSKKSKKFKKLDMSDLFSDKPSE